MVTVSVLERASSQEIAPTKDLLSVMFEVQQIMKETNTSIVYCPVGKDYETNRFAFKINHKNLFNSMPEHKWFEAYKELQDRDYFTGPGKKQIILYEE